MTRWVHRANKQADPHPVLVYWLRFLALPMDLQITVLRLSRQLSWRWVDPSWKPSATGRRRVKSN
jgi:hypothetical protein